MYKKLLLFILYLTAGFAIALADDEELVDWAARQTEVLPEMVNGVKMYRPEIAGNVLLTSDLIEMPNAKADQIFLKTLMFVKEKLDPQYYSIEAVDFNNKRFSVYTNKLPSGSSANQYSYTSAFQGSDGLLSFTCSEMKVDFKEAGLLSRTLKFEKLKPESNEKHKKMIEEQAFLFSSMIKDLQTYIPLRDNIRVKYPEYIIRGEVIAGMNPDEVIMTLGVPFSKKKSGGRDKWLFESGTSIIFTDGVVSNVMY